MMLTTFSIVGRCPKTGELGVCASTAVPAVGDRVPHVEADVGAIATQAKTNIYYGNRGLELLKMSFSPRKALEVMLTKDRDKESRQVVIIDKLGRTAAFTGKKTPTWSGHFVGRDFVAAGNMLVGENVMEAMTEAFKSTQGDLAEKLMKSLEAGQNAGGDKRGKVSAALLVAKREDGSHPYMNLRVDKHRDPVRKLRNILEAFCREHSGKQ